MSADGGAQFTYELMAESVPNAWLKAATVGPAAYECGFCSNQVGSNIGYTTGGNGPSIIRICPRCNRPTYFDMTSSSPYLYPGSLPGTSIRGIPRELGALYEEARASAKAGAYTGAVMLCRKILMNISVREGAKEGLGFKEYCKFLEENHYFSPKSKDFVTYIKDLGNEANHQIAPKKQDDALAAIEFVRALLSHNYELPGKIPTKGSEVVIEVPFVRGSDPNPLPTGT